MSGVCRTPQGWKVSVTEGDKPSQVSMALAGVVLTILGIALVVLIFASIGALAAITVESYQWFRQALNWV